METKHTKGEWKISKEPFTVLILGETENGKPISIASITGCREQEANAKLIEAAPDMLESLKELLRFKAELRHVMGDKLASPENFLKAIEVAEKVIEKVTE